MVLFLKSKRKDQLKKWDLRLQFLVLREAISETRRKQASIDLTNFLEEKLKKFQAILSFCPKFPEIDLSLINEDLAKQNKLLLPKVQHEHLEIYHVNDLKNQLAPSKWGVLEPIPEKCQKASLKEIDCVLVPAVVFDKEHSRIGYGKGYYDRLIANLPTNELYGVGFKEQLYDGHIPRCKHDQPMKELLLF